LATGLAERKAARSFWEKLATFCLKNVFENGQHLAHPRKQVSKTLGQHCVCVLSVYTSMYTIYKNCKNAVCRSQFHLIRNLITAPNFILFIVTVYFLFLFVGILTSIWYVLYEP
jgi:hypothetical protein